MIDYTCRCTTKTEAQAWMKSACTVVLDQVRKSLRSGLQMDSCKDMVNYTRVCLIEQVFRWTDW